MASRGKKKTTFAKLARESKLRERRIDKKAKKDARKRASETEGEPAPDFSPEFDPARTSEPSPVEPG